MDVANSAHSWKGPVKRAEECPNAGPFAGYGRGIGEPPAGLPKTRTAKHEGRDLRRALRITSGAARAYLPVLPDPPAGVGPVLINWTSKIKVAFGGIGGCGSAPYARDAGMNNL